MRIAFFGYQQPGYTCLKELIKSGHEVVLVVTHLDAAGEKIWFGSVKDVAVSNKIPVYAAEKIDWGLIGKRLKDLRPDLLLSAYFRERIPGEILHIPALGAVNLHGSLLPKYRGRVPVNWAIIRGEKLAGFTFHFMEDAFDSGDMILSERIPIGPQDEAIDIYRKMDSKLPQALRRLIGMFRSGRITRRRQDEAAATCFGRRRPEDGRVAWQKKARELHDLVRALASPWPGAFTTLRGRKLYIWKSRAGACRRRRPVSAGTVVSVSSVRGLGVLCGNGLLWCRELQLEGDRRMGASAFARRYDVRRGEILV